MEELIFSNKILQNERYKQIVEHIEELESDRIFCHHDMAHFLDVARIAVLMAAEEDLPIKRDIIYSAALLHDIGRAEQYINGTAHEAAGVPIAGKILDECGFCPGDITEIIEAVRQHGNVEIRDKADLTGLIYRADKASRRCYMCKASDRCHKAPEKRVQEIRY